MTQEKFVSETETLKKFLQTYCGDKHCNQQQINQTIIYQNKFFEIQTNLCEECQVQYNYSLDKLLECPHIEKPRCRKCPNPCYEKSEWKKISKIMRYSGLKLGIIKIKNRFFS
jgi:hypothetical protein